MPYNNIYNIITSMYVSFSFSSEISWINLENDLKCSLISLFLLIGQLSVFDSPDINLSLSFPRSSHWNIKWSMVCSVVPHGHVGDSIILNLCRYDFMFPCPVVIVVNIGVNTSIIVLNFLLSLTLLVLKQFALYCFLWCDVLCCVTNWK